MPRASDALRAMRLLGLASLSTVPNIGPASASDDRVEIQSPHHAAVPAETFLNSLGICIHYAQGVGLQSYRQPLRYLGVRNVRDDLGDVQGYIDLRQEVGVKADLIARSDDLNATLEAFRTLARHDALLAIEGPNEPNNFKIRYRGRIGGGLAGASKDPVDWTPVAEFQRDLYAAVKADQRLAPYPVFQTSEAGAESPNVGLQYLTVPIDADATFPAGTRYADYANVHNYVTGTKPQYVDNQAWKAADPVLNDAWDGLYVEYGRLWASGFEGYTGQRLVDLPRVTTETGWDADGGPGTERLQGTVLLNTYFAQFKRGWTYTFVYMLRDGEGGEGHQGVFRSDSTPKLAAHYIHNLTSILFDAKTVAVPQSMDYAIEHQPDTTHDLLMQLDGTRFALALWSERVAGSDELTLLLPGNGKTARVYDPTIGTEALAVYDAPKTIAVVASDHPVIVTFE